MRLRSCFHSQANSELEIEGLTTPFSRVNRRLRVTLYGSYIHFDGFTEIFSQPFKSSIPTIQTDMPWDKVNNFHRFPQNPIFEKFDTILKCGQRGRSSLLLMCSLTVQINTVQIK
jgi:hypothetical protein